MDIELIPAILLAGVGLLGVPCLCYLQYRNCLVFDTRLAVLDDPKFSTGDNLKRYDMLPSYNRMLWQLFTFDWTRYLVEAKKKD